MPAIPLQGPFFLLEKLVFHPLLVRAAPVLDKTLRPNGTPTDLSLMQVAPIPDCTKPHPLVFPKRGNSMRSPQALKCPLL